MRLTGILAITLVFSTGIVGCANRRCCRCSCQQQTQQMAVEEKAAETNNVPAFATISDIPIVESEPIPPKIPIAIPAAIPVPIAQVPPNRPSVATPKKDTTPPVKFVKRKTQPKATTEKATTKTTEQVATKIAKKAPIYGHAEDYSWLRGRLHKVHVPGVEWKIRYMPIDKLDELGGSMVLAPDIRLEDFNDQDLVYIEGKQLEARPSLYVTGPLYRIETIRPLEPFNLPKSNKRSALLPSTDPDASSK